MDVPEDQGHLLLVFMKTFTNYVTMTQKLVDFSDRVKVMENFP
jgi:hypothetical protein